MNKLTIIGNLTRDPELRTVNVNGTATNVCTMSIAVNDGYGEKQKTTFVRVTAWRALADVCMKYLSKGKKVYVEGPVNVNLYTGNDGQAHASLEMLANNIEFLSPASTTTATTTATAATVPVAVVAQPIANKAPTPVVPVNAVNTNFVQIPEIEELPF